MLFFELYRILINNISHLFLTNILDIISFVGSLLSFAATIIIAKLQYDQGKRMEELSIKQDNEQRIEKAQRIEAARNSFIMKYYNEDDDIYMLPLCWIASIYDPAYAYHRKMYMEYNMLEEDVQKAICEYMHFNVEKPKNDREAFYSDCVKALQEAEHRNYIDNIYDSIYYDNAKYLRMTFSEYGRKKLPLNLNHLETRLTDLLRTYRKNPRECPNPLLEFLKEYNYFSREEFESCELCAVLSKWLAEFDPDEYSEDYWVPGEYRYECISTMEDLFLCALYCTYVFLIMPPKKGDEDE